MERCSLKKPDKVSFLLDEFPQLPRMNIWTELSRHLNVQVREREGRLIQV